MITLGRCTSTGSVTEKGSMLRQAQRPKGELAEPRRQVVGDKSEQTYSETISVGSGTVY